MFPFTLRLQDPLGNSFVGSLEHENPVDDPNITVSEISYWALNHHDHTSEIHARIFFRFF